MAKKLTPEEREEKAGIEIKSILDQYHVRLGTESSVVPTRFTVMGVMLYKLISRGVQKQRLAVQSTIKIIAEKDEAK